jgi:hypothetical protein
MLTALALASTAPAGAECAADPQRADLSPWVGEWHIAGAAGEVTGGTTTLRPILDGCAFEEVRRRADGSESRGLVFFDAVVGAWQERWVSSDGEIGSFRFTVDGDRLLVAGTVTNRNGSTALRAELAPRQGGGFVESLQVPDDAGSGWSQPLRTLYLPAGVDAAGALATAAPEPATKVSAPTLPAPEPVAPASAAPEREMAAPAVPAAVPTPRVTVRSERLAEDAAESVPMASPMTLEFELGPLDRLPPDTGWTTDELAPYVADQVEIPRVTASHREHRKASGIELTLQLRTTAFQRKVDVQAALLSSDDVVAEAQAEAVTLGKLITSHDPHEGRAVSLDFTLDRATFNSLFADGKRPRVRLTVAVR